MDSDDDENDSLVELDSDDSEDASDDNENVMLEDDEVTDQSDQYFAAGDQGMTPNGVEYIRTVPEQFNEESPNKFMRSMIENYALEQKTAKGEPSGIFRMNQKQTMQASKDVVAKNKKLEGKALDDFMSQYFERTWEHFDVNKETMLDVLDMPPFMKYLCSDQAMDLDGMM